MAKNPAVGTGSHSAAIGLWSLIVLIFSGFGTWVKADEVCLKIGFPDMAPKFILESYEQAMRSAGLCVNAVLLPYSRMATEMDHGEIDGVSARIAEFSNFLDLPILRTQKPIMNFSGYLLTRDENVAEIGDLTTQSVGIWMGAYWAAGMLGDYPYVVKVPGGPKMLLRMLAYKRVDAALVDGYSLAYLGGAPQGVYTVKLRDFQAYGWLRAQYATYLGAFEKGTELYTKWLGAQSWGKEKRIGANELD